MDINVGDIVKLKKQHPCGSKEWEVLRLSLIHISEPTIPY